MSFSYYFLSAGRPAFWFLTLRFFGLVTVYERFILSYAALPQFSSRPGVLQFLQIRPPFHAGAYPKITDGLFTVAHRVRHTVCILTSAGFGPCLTALIRRRLCPPTPVLSHDSIYVSTIICNFISLIINDLQTIIINTPKTFAVLSRIMEDKQIIHRNNATQ